MNCISGKFNNEFSYQQFLNKFLFVIKFIK